MKKIACVCPVFLFCLLIINQNVVCGYGYAKEEDPLIKVFKNIIYYGRQADWPRVSTEVNSIHDRIADIRNIFKIDLGIRINQAIHDQDFQTLANQMANLVFLAIREKFYYNRQEKLEIFVRSKVRLRLAEEYYTALLAGNVRDYDIRHKTALHDGIYNRFVNARDAIGSMGFLGTGAVKPNLHGFETLTKEIETLLIRAFPYFETGQAAPE
ncbi:MAG: hypothetical protein A3J92_02920 [Planctomycetes bacterium RIFOXYC2_FULL_41_27]|nr:MAG: hypothetical protein A3J92_02920 [Planctomycetes bacterium RIFOXYC2_FULL_41_27]